jgi:hypothetical protein
MSIGKYRRDSDYECACGCILIIAVVILVILFGVLLVWSVS